MTTIEERLRRAHDALTLIGASCAAHAAGIDAEDIRDAMLSAAIDAREELYWLKQLPAVLLTLPAADSEEIEHKFGVGAAVTERIETLVLKELDEVIAERVRFQMEMTGRGPRARGAEVIPPIKHAPALKTSTRSKSAKKGGA